MPLRIFRSSRGSGANLVQAGMTAAFFGFFFLGSLDFERVLGYGPLLIGLAFLPVAVAMGVLSVRFSAVLIMRFGPHRVLLVGRVIIAAALAVLAIGPLYGNYVRDLFVPMMLLSVGGGLSFPSLAMIAMSGVTPHEAGVASGLLNTTGQVGGALGLAVLATLSSGHTGSLISTGHGVAAALGGGYHFAWGIGAAIATVTVVLAAVVLKPGVRQRAASTTASEELAA